MRCGKDDSPPSSDSEPPYFNNQPAPTFNAANICDNGTSVPSLSLKQKLLEQRRHPRRTSVRTAVRQTDRKVKFVHSLVGKIYMIITQVSLLNNYSLDSSAQVVEAIWPLASISCRSEMGSKDVLPLRTFIEETLRRSRTSYSILQVALYYLILIKPHVPKHDFTMEQPDDTHSVKALHCGRRMFLSALILASKYLQDRNYSARAWNKISGLNPLEINQNEMAFLLAIDWKLHITDIVFKRWTDIVLTYNPSQPPRPAAFCPKLAEKADWKAVILMLNSNLDNIEEITMPASAQAKVQLTVASPQPFRSFTVERYPTVKDGPAKSTSTPEYMNHPPSSTYPSSKPTPVLGLLPTPRLTPQSTGFNTPAVSAASYMLYKPARNFATAPDSFIFAGQVTDNLYQSSSQAYVSARRSSLANSASSVSSPESMISDNSPCPSRSPSISSAEGSCDNISMSLAESYTRPVGKDFLDVSLGMPLARCPRTEDSPSGVGVKRSRPESFDRSLQEHVREMLNGHFDAGQLILSDREWIGTLAILYFLLDQSPQHHLAESAYAAHRSKAWAP